MTLETLTGAGLSLGAAAVWGGGDFAGGIATKRANVFRVVAGAHACGLVLMLLLAWLTGEPVPPRSSLWWGVAAGVSGAFGIAALYKALAIGRMGIVAPVASVITGILPVLFAIRTEGMPDRIQLAGFALALVSIWLVARPSGEIDSHRGLGLAVLAGVMFGLFLVAGKQAGHHGVFWPLVAARTASTLLMLIIVAFSPRDTRSLRAALRSDSPLRIARLRRQRHVHRRHPPWAPRRRRRAVVALSRQYGDPGARAAEGASLPDAERRHRGRSALSRADLGAIEQSAMQFHCPKSLDPQGKRGYVSLQHLRRRAHPARRSEMRAIFVSYRRDDSEGEAGRLFDDLVAIFGENSVFMDVAAIEAGRDFRKVIDESVATCGVLLAVIGKGWIDAKNEAGQRRLDDPSDFVRLETASALKRDIAVIPVLVHDARMPRPEELPDDLKDLAYRNGVALTHPRWSSDLQLLVKALRPHVEAPENVAGSSSQAEAGAAAARRSTVTVSNEMKVPEAKTGTSSPTAEEASGSNSRPGRGRRGGSLRCDLHDHAKTGDRPGAAAVAGRDSTLGRGVAR